MSLVYIYGRWNNENSVWKILDILMKKYGIENAGESNIIENNLMATRSYWINNIGNLTDTLSREKHSLYIYIWTSIWQRMKSMAKQAFHFSPRKAFITNILYTRKSINWIQVTRYGLRYCRLQKNLTLKFGYYKKLTFKKVNNELWISPKK